MADDCVFRTHHHRIPMADPVSLTGGLNHFAGVGDGTILIRFRNYGKQGYMPLFSVVNGQYPSSWVTIYIKHAQEVGMLKHLLSSDRTISTTLDLRGEAVVDPDFINTVAVTAKAGEGYALYFNGRKLRSHSDTGATLFTDLAALAPLRAAVLGDFFESQKIQEKHYVFSGDIDFLRIYNRAFSDDEMENVTGYTREDYSAPGVGVGHRSGVATVYFAGCDGSRNYRIPALYRTDAGTLLASIDQRVNGYQDHQNIIRTVLRRSTDNGVTFGPVIRAVSLPADGQTIDSSMLQDRRTGRIFLITSSHPATFKNFESRPGNGYAEVDGQYGRVLVGEGGRQYIVHPDGKVFREDGAGTDYSVDAGLNLFRGVERQGSIYSVESPLAVYPTTDVLLVHSDDDGETWSVPRSLNSMVTADWMPSLTVAPGRGLQFSAGPYKDRLCFPVYYSNVQGQSSSAVIFSDDGGESWTRGESPNDGRLFRDSVLESRTIDREDEQLTECQIAEMPDGSAKLFIRNMNGFVAVADSDDGCASWAADVALDPALRDAYCQCSVANLEVPVDGLPALVFANADSISRSRGRIKVGLIEERPSGGWDVDWRYTKTIKPGFFAYSCLAPMADGGVGILYEGTPATNISFESMDLDYLSGGDAQRNPTMSVRPRVSTKGGQLAAEMDFDETVMLSGDVRLEIRTPDKVVDAYLAAADINGRNYTFTAPWTGIRGNDRIHAALPDGLDIHRVNGESIQKSERI